MGKKITFLFLLGILIFSLMSCTIQNKDRRPDSDTLYVGSVQTSFPTSFMPWLSRDGIAPTIAGMLYDTLFSFDEETGIYEPLIGREWYYVDENGEPIVTEDGEIDYERLETIYSDPEYKYLPVKIIIHDNITWSDGVPLTVEDIYYTLDIATNNSLSNHAGALAWTSDLQHKYEDGVLVQQGIFTYENGALEQGYDISEEEKDTVIYLHVNKVLGSITSLFTSVLILPKHIWEPIVTIENQLNSANPTEETLYHYQNPVGSGKYILDTKQSSGQQIILHLRDDYHLVKENGSSLHNIKTIKFILYQEINVAIYALLKGHIDVLDATISSNYLSLFEKEEDIFISNAPGIFIQSLVLNVNPVSSACNPIRDLLSNVNFRKAIALAIDQKYLIKNVLDDAGVEVSSGLMRESMIEFYNSEADNLSTDYEERISEANEILDNIVPKKDKDGYRLLNGQRISFDILGSPGEQDTISYLEILFHNIGIEVNYAAKGSQPETTYLYNSEFDMTLQGVCFSLSNIDIMYRAHFSALGRTSNYGRLENSMLNEKIEEMRYTLNLNRKYELIKEIQPMLANEYYKIPLYVSNVISVARTDRFEGYQVVEGATVLNNSTLENLRKVESE